MRIFAQLKYNARTIIGFEVLFKLLTAIIIIPSGQLIIQGLLDVTGYYYLTLENISRFMRHPLVILLFVLCLFCLSIYTTLDASAILFVMDRGYQKKKVTILQTVRFSFRNTKRVLKKENLGILVFILILMPFILVGEIGIIYTTITIPSFVTSEIEKNRMLIMIAILFLVLFYMFFIRWLYTFHYFTLEQKDFSASAHSSSRLSRKYRWKDGCTLAGVQFVFYMMSFLLVTLGIILVLGMAKVFSELHLLNYIYTCTVWVLLIVVILLVTAVGTPISYIAITILYYLHKESSGERIIHGSIVVERIHDRHQRKVRMTETAILCFAVFAVTILIYTISTQKVNPQVEYFRTMEVTAHRGASEFFPENTMAAFQGAVDLGADWIELDVQQSKDEQIFVMHDKGFYRTTGVRKMSWELDYDEIAKLDAGSFFSPTFEGERIPLLSEVIDFAIENNVRLNIELKPSVHDEGLEKRVVDMILEKDFVDSCIVTSQIYESLEKVKAYCEDIHTVYVMSLAYGNVNRLTAADAFSMEAASVTPIMVSRIHNAGKQIFVWTVNSKKKINRMIDLNVDNIITDRVALAKQYIYESKTSTVIQKYVEFLRE